MGRNRATLADVARRAGLSKTAASMVLNGREGTRLSAEAHQRVFAAAEELGYRPTFVGVIVGVFVGVLVGVRVGVGEVFVGTPQPVLLRRSPQPVRVPVS